MFSLIITIISVALVAALALATLYYGGDAFNQGKADAEAAQILNQGQQVLGAAELYYLKNSAWPATPQDLVEGGFLESIPVAQGPMSEAYAQATRAWEMPTAGVPVFTLPNVETDICKMVNKKTYGLDGVLKQAYTSLSAQCYGTTENAYTVVVSKGGERLSAALPSTDVAAAPALPSPTDEASWDQLPGTTGSTTPVTPPPSGSFTGLLFEKDNEPLWVSDGYIDMKLTNTGTEPVTVSELSATVTASGSPVLLNIMEWSFAASTSVLSSNATVPLSDFCENETIAPGASVGCYIDRFGPTQTPAGTVSLTISYQGNTQTFTWTKEAPLPEGTDAAACLRTTNTTNINPEVNGNIALYNGCSRPLVARAFDEHNAVNDMFDVMGYSATLNGEGNIFLPTIDFGWVYTDEDPSGPSPLGIPSGPLEFSLFANLYSGPYVVHESSSVGENDAVRLYAFRHYGGATQVRNQNTIQLEVKFADQDDSAYVPYSFVVTLVPGAGCGDPENDGDWVCVTP